MLAGTEITPSAIMASKGIKAEPPMLQMNKPGLSSSNKGKVGAFTKTTGPTEGEESGCTHCKKPKHTCETCFKLHGYPDWWNELKARKQQEATRVSGWLGMQNRNYLLFHRLSPKMDQLSLLMTQVILVMSYSILLKVIMGIG